MAGMSSSSSVTVYVGLGSNDERARDYLTLAVEGLSALAGVRLDALSPVYRTEPQDYGNQPWFHNQVVRLLVDEGRPETAPRALMEAFLDIERRLGRVRSDDPALRYGPRCVDVDMLLYGDVTSDDPVVILPHPRLVRRAFWLVPLRDLEPDLVVDGVPVRDLLSRMDHRLEGDRIYQ